MGFRDQLKDLSRDAGRDFVGQMKGLRPTPEQQADIEWAAEQCMAARVLSLGSPERLAELAKSESYLQAVAVLGNYRMAGELAARAAMERSVRKVFFAAVKVAFEIAL